MKRKNKDSQFKRYGITFILISLLTFLLYKINIFTITIFPKIAGEYIYPLGFIYDWITITLFITVAIYIADKLIGYPKILSNPINIFIGVFLTTFLTLTIWYVFVALFPNIFGNIVAESLYGIIVALVYFKYYEDD